MLERKPAMAGEVIGVRVRLEHSRDPHAAALGLLEVGLDGVRRVDEHGLACFLVTDQIGRAAEVVIHELAKEHCLTLSGRPADFPGCARARI